MTNERIANGFLGELGAALRVLADSHTRDDRAAGFVVESMRDTLRDHAEYIDAWRIVRQALGYQIG